MLIDHHNNPTGRSRRGTLVLGGVTLALVWTGQLALASTLGAKSAPAPLAAATGDGPHDTAFAVADPVDTAVEEETRLARIIHEHCD